MLTIINSIKNNVHNPMAKKDKSLTELTLQNYNDYKIHKDLILYLRKTGNSYQGKNFKKFKNVETFFFKTIILNVLLCIILFIYSELRSMYVCIILYFFSF